MATTSIWRVKGWLGKVVVYVENPDKTTNPKFYTDKDMTEQDGQELSDSLDVKYKNYTDAIEQILRDDTITALLSGNEIMTITVIGPDGQRSEEIFSEVEACAARRSNTYCYFATSEETAPAHETGLSCGKYRAYLELQHLDPDITPGTVQGMTMREIRELIDHLSDHPSGDKDAGTSSYDNRRNGHHGHGYRAAP